MPSDAGTGIDHTVTVRSVQVYHGTFDSDFVTEEGDLTQVAEDIEFHHEESLSLRCSCGKWFRKYRTAGEHLSDVKNDG